MSTKGIPTFPRTRHGYEPTAVDEFLWQESHTKQSLLNDNQILQNRLSEALREVSALKTEIDTLYDTSMSLPSVAHRISKLLRTTVEEISTMQSEAQTEAASIVTTAQAEADNLLNDAEDDAKRWIAAAQTEVATLLDDAKAAAAQHLQQAERAAEEAHRQQITTLQQLAAVHRNLANVPTVLESAYRQRNDPPTPSTSQGVAPATTEAGASVHAYPPSVVAPPQLSTDSTTLPLPEPPMPHRPQPLHQTPA